MDLRPVLKMINAIRMPGGQSDEKNCLSNIIRWLGESIGKGGCSGRFIQCYMLQIVTIAPAFQARLTVKWFLIKSKSEILTTILPSIFGILHPDAP